jgi:hypothetical protein
MIPSLARSLAVGQLLIEPDAVSRIVKTAKTALGDIVQIHVVHQLTGEESRRTFGTNEFVSTEYPYVLNVGRAVITVELAELGLEELGPRYWCSIADDDYGLIEPRAEVRLPVGHAAERVDAARLVLDRLGGLGDAYGESVLDDTTDALSTAPFSALTAEWAFQLHDELRDAVGGLKPS